MKGSSTRLLFLRYVFFVTQYELIVVSSAMSVAQVFADIICIIALSPLSHSTGCTRLFIALLFHLSILLFECFHDAFYSFQWLRIKIFLQEKEVINLIRCTLYKNLFPRESFLPKKKPIPNCPRNTRLWTFWPTNPVRLCILTYGTWVALTVDTCGKYVDRRGDERTKKGKADDWEVGNTRKSNTSRNGF